MAIQYNLAKRTCPCMLASGQTAYLPRIELELQFGFDPDQKVCAAFLKFPTDALTCSDTLGLALSVDGLVS